MTAPRPVRLQLSRRKGFERVISASLEPYETEDEADVRVAKKRITEIRDDPKKIVSGAALAKRLAKLETL